jgi:hypothetical protein
MAFAIASMDNPESVIATREFLKRPFASRSAESAASKAMAASHDVPSRFSHDGV